MEKYLQSSWMRVLSSIICTISVVAMLIGIFVFAVVTEVGGTDELYDIGYDRIAENYGIYAVEMLEGDVSAFVAAEFEEKKINCVITRVSQEPGENDEIHTVEEVLFTTGEIGEERVFETSVAPESIRRYRTTSLAGALFGTYSYSPSGEEWTEFPIEKVLFDTASGVFYYQTSMGLYKVAEIIVLYGIDTVIGENEVIHEQESVDYLIGWENGKQVYQNGYYQAILDTSEYKTWEAVVINGRYMELGAVGQWPNVIEVVSDGSLDLSVIKTKDYMIEYDSISCPYGEDLDIYQVQVSCREEAGSLFAEWNELVVLLSYLYRIAIPMMVFGFIAFVISFVLMICSAKTKKEQLNFMEKVPVFLYSGAICIIDILLVALMLGVVEWTVMNDIKDLNSLGILCILLSMVAVWLALNWFQNIVTRIKCKSFWRTSEFYYLYILVKNSWDKIRKFFAVLFKPFAFIMKPFVALYVAIKNFCNKVQENTTLVAGGLGIFGVISVIEFAVLYLSRWQMYRGTAFVSYWFIKLVEAVALLVALFQMQEMLEGSRRVASGDMSKPIDTTRMFWKFKEHGENINKVSDGIALAVNERMKSEHFKTELITNVSHDIKTPLTSIINYVDLIKKEDIEDEKLQEYVDVLDRQSARLKKLIEDLMEASKASTGNLTVNLEECDVEVLLTQVIGEFEEKLQKNQLEVVVDKPEHPVKMMADGRHIWRVLDNLLNNACKYSLPGTRVYVSLKQDNKEAVIVFKNISKDALNIPSDELMERFVRGDSSRNTEGSGLGLSIAQSLTELMHGTMKLEIDGDLFKVILRFPTI